MTTEVGTTEDKLTELEADLAKLRAGWNGLDHRLGETNRQIAEVRQRIREAGYAAFMAGGKDLSEAERLLSELEDLDRRRTIVRLALEEAGLQHSRAERALAAAQRDARRQEIVGRLRHHQGLLERGLIEEAEKMSGEISTIRRREPERYREAVVALSAEESSPGGE